VNSSDLEARIGLDGAGRNGRLQATDANDENGVTLNTASVNLREDGPEFDNQ